MMYKQPDVQIEAYPSDNQLETLQRVSKWSEDGHSIVREERNYTCTKKELREFILKNFWDGAYQTLEISVGEWLVRSEDILIRTSIRSGAVRVLIVGTQRSVVASYLAMFDDSFTQASTFIHWMHSENGRSIEVPMSIERLPIEEMYPFLNGEPLTDYYTRFLRSSASILLLIGPPGTGKTSFIRGLIHHSEMDALVCYDSNLLERDTIFTHFVDDEDLGMMILEDSDNFLRPRSDGNTMMHRFLNIGDGLVTLSGKKMVFSTNLPSVADIDTALTRPGRCFDILEFKPLTKTQANLVANKLGTALPKKKDGEYSIAEIFHEKTNGMVSAGTKRKMGFT